MHVEIDKKMKPHQFVDFKAMQRKSAEFGFSWLDSSMKVGDKGQNSYLMSEPIADIYLLNDEIHVKSFDQKFAPQNSGNDIYRFIEELVHQYDLCAVGYISYESTLEKFGVTFKQKTTLPSTRFLLYKRLNKLPNDIEYKDNNLSSDLISDVHLTNSISKDAYLQKILKIKDYIKEGDIYQANFTTKFDVFSPLSPFDSYLRLRELNPAPYSAYLNFGDYQILSSSPERMFKIENRKITSCPIKGTIALGDNAEEQKINLNKLINSAKDKAELLMIVDLMRNDLGKIAKTGTVTVDSLYNPEIYSSLIHLVSDISADLRKDVSLKEIIDALIPGGSITGTPKKRAIEIIDEMETSSRFVYTGSIGYITKEKSDFNIAIRTMYHQDNNYSIHAGGGIIADSDPEDEYNEMLLKAKNLFKAVGLKHD